MEPEIQKAYEDLFHTFTTEGWSNFLGDINGTKLAIENRILNDRLSEADYNYEAGQLAVIRNIIYYEESCRNNYENLSQQEEDEL